MSKATSAGDEQREGFALLLVIWILALMAVLAAGVAAVSQSESKIARNRMELAEARGLAESGVTLAVANLLVPDMTLRWHADGTTRTMALGDGTVAITAQDEAGKIDLNQAPLEFIASLFDTLDPETKEIRETVMAGIAEQRQAAASSANTANTGSRSFELPGRRRSSASLSKAAFANLSELKQIPGMTTAAFERLRPFITVYSQSATINPLTAPREVLAALPGIDPTTIDLYIAARQVPGTAQSSPNLPSFGATASRYLSIADLAAVTITATATVKSGITFSREAVVAFEPTAALPFRYLEWHQDTGAAEALTAQAGP